MLSEMTLQKEKLSTSQSTSLSRLKDEPTQGGWSEDQKFVVADLSSTDYFWTNYLAPGGVSVAIVAR